MGEFWIDNRSNLVCLPIEYPGGWFETSCTMYEFTLTKLRSMLTLDVANIQHCMHSTSRPCNRAANLVSNRFLQVKK